jgi:glycosyltransferase involved in cell wall biosynthesis
MRREVKKINVDISIVIPLYNKELYLEQVLGCIEGQTYTNWECIIVDDGSTDQSSQLVKDFISSRGDKWRYVRQENKGQAAARNVGIELSQGRYIAFLDADDYWPSYKLESQISPMDANLGLAAVLSPFVIFSSKSLVPRLVIHRKTEKLLLGWITMRGFGGGIESVGLIRRSLLGIDLRFDESLSTSSGLDFFLRLSELGDIGFVKRIGLLYQISEGQWHSNTEELIRNLKVIRGKYPNYPSSTLIEWHDSYIYWAKVKSEGWVHFLSGLANALFHPKKYWRLWMIWSLISRNIFAKLIGLVYLHKVNKLLVK